MPMALLESFKQTTPSGSIVNGPPIPPLTADAKFSGVSQRSFTSLRALNSGEYEDRVSGIRVVVGIDLEYKKSKEASISIWRLKTTPGHDGQPNGEVIQELDNELFRDVEGNPILLLFGLELPLNNFAVQALSNGLPDCSAIVGPETLCILLAEAEKWNDKSTLL
ncbi:hypothetical protein BKA65DRAFT_470977 [Rhexocercosporidium sp. MPI-PUGE-AT-0058]|nr:hypothetical protein BKA65DRAFT_470977 [Rhexocercosporidium sp. MPI-PUGE-AT-0058]